MIGYKFSTGADKANPQEILDCCGWCWYCRCPFPKVLQKTTPTVESTMGEQSDSPVSFLYWDLFLVLHFTPWRPARRPWSPEPWTGTAHWVFWTQVVMNRLPSFCAWKRTHRQINAIAIKPNWWQNIERRLCQCQTFAWKSNTFFQKAGFFSMLYLWHLIC